MSYSEDAQPNEVRHARKGNTHVPAIRSSRPVLGSQRQGHVSQRGRGLSRGRGRGYNGPVHGPHVSGPRQDAALSAGGPSSSHASRPGQSTSNWRGSTPNWAHRRHHRSSRTPKKPRLEDAGIIPGVNRVSSTDAAEDRAPLRAAALHDPLSLDQPDPLDEPLLTYRSPTPDGFGRIPSSEISGPSGSTHEPSSRSTSGVRQQPWSFDPRHPSLSISLARAFSASMSSNTKSYDGTHIMGPPVRTSPPGDRSLDRELLGFGEHSHTITTELLWITDLFVS